VNELLSMGGTPLRRVALRAATVIFALLALHACPTRAQPAACAANSGAIECIASRASYFQIHVSPSPVYATGNEACIGSAGSYYGDIYRNTEFKQQYVSASVTQGYVDLIEGGGLPPPIKIDGDVIIDGNHRFIAGLLCREIPLTVPGTANLTAPKYFLRDVIVEP
jgi:hypothetical protein